MARSSGLRTGPTTYTSLHFAVPGDVTAHTEPGPPREYCQCVAPERSTCGRARFVRPSFVRDTPHWRKVLTETT